jgi:nucleoside-diphosphate-sugar epimerase
MNDYKKTVLVAGTQGVIGRAAAEHYSKQAGTTVYGISRRPIDGLDSIKPISADLLNPEDTCSELAHLTDVTHVVFGAYVEKSTPTERSTVNVALLGNPPLLALPREETATDRIPIRQHVRRVGP